MPFNQSLDKRRGAPFGVRAVVGSLENPQDRLATLRKWYPDAQPYDDDNSVFTDPDTGRPTLYNPPGIILDLGDFASVGGEVAEFGGGVVGGAAVPSVQVRS